MTTPEAHARASMEVIAASLRRERRRTGLSLSELARKADLSKSTLSQLEAGIGNPSLETLWALCIALDAPFSRLVDPPAPRPRLIRAGEGPAVSSSQAEYRATLLAACPPGARPGHLLHRRRARPPAHLRAAPARRGRARGAQHRPGPGRPGR